MITEEIIKNRKLFGSFDPVTYVTTEAFDHVLQNKDLKYPWCVHMAYRKQTVSADYLYSIAPDRCPATGEWLDYGLGENKLTEEAMWRPSIDQIKPSAGYVEGNVQICSWRANRIKNDIRGVWELEGIRKLFPNG
jgi:hypothetical protein